MDIIFRKPRSPKTTDKELYTGGLAAVPHSPAAYCSNVVAGLPSSDQVVAL